MITKLLITLLTITLFLTSCEQKEGTSQQQTSQKDTSTATEQKANVLTMTATDGKTYKLEAKESGINFEGLENQVVLLDFFATWCPPCRAEMPHLVNLQKKYAGKMQILAVLMEEDKENAEVISFGEEYSVNFPILNSKENFLLSQALGGIRSLPTLVMYDREGNYFTHYVGAAPEEMIEADIKKALAK